jgi:hypothetical protein
LLFPILYKLLEKKGWEIIPEGAKGKERYFERSNVLIRGHFGPKPLDEGALTLEEIKENSSNKIIIFLYRDPRDLLVSAMNHQRNAIVTADQEKHKLYQSMTEEQVILRLANNYYWGMRLNDLCKYILSQREDSRVYTLTYEDLISNRVLQVKIILKMANVPYDDRDIIRTAENTDAFKNQGRLVGQEDKDNHYRKGIIGDWKNHFTHTIKNKIKSECGKELVELGYANDFNW